MMGSWITCRRRLHAWPLATPILSLFLTQALHARINPVSSLSGSSNKDQRATQHQEWKDFQVTWIDSRNQCLKHWVQIPFSKEYQRTPKWHLKPSLWKWSPSDYIYPGALPPPTLLLVSLYSVWNQVLSSIQENYGNVSKVLLIFNFTVASTFLKIPTTSAQVRWQQILTIQAPCATAADLLWPSCGFPEKSDNQCKDEEVLPWQNRALETHVLSAELSSSGVCNSTNTDRFHLFLKDLRIHPLFNKCHYDMSFTFEVPLWILTYFSFFSCCPKRELSCWAPLTTESEPPKEWHSQMSYCMFPP